MDGRVMCGGALCCAEWCSLCCANTVPVDVMQMSSKARIMLRVTTASQAREGKEGRGYGGRMYLETCIKGLKGDEKDCSPNLESLSQQDKQFDRDARSCRPSALAAPASLSC